jgi:hypothetical protein
MLSSGNNTKNNCKVNTSIINKQVLNSKIIPIAANVIKASSRRLINRKTKTAQKLKETTAVQDTLKLPINPVEYIAFPYSGSTGSANSVSILKQQQQHGTGTRNVRYGSHWDVHPAK